MIIAIDYHGTYSRNPEGFAALVSLMKGRGHECILVTGIEDNGDLYAKEVREIVGDTMRIVFAVVEVHVAPHYAGRLRKVNNFI